MKQFLFFSSFLRNIRSVEEFFISQMSEVYTPLRIFCTKKNGNDGIDRTDFCYEIAKVAG